MRDDVFRAVAAEGERRKGYDALLHHRVHSLIEEWLRRPEGSNIAYAATGPADASFDAEVRDCTAWVRREYRATYGTPVIGFLLWPLIGGIVSWIVQRTLNRLYPAAN